VLRLQIVFFSGALLCTVIFESIYEHDPGHRALIYCVGIYLLAQAPSRTLRAVFRTFERTKYEAVTTLLEKSVVLLFACTAVALNLSLEYFVRGLAILGVVNIIVLATVCERFFVKLKWRFVPRSVQSAILAAAVPLGVSALFTIVNLRIGTLILERFYGTVQVGLFGAAQRLITPVAYIVLTLQASVLPMFVRRMSLEAEAVRVALNSLTRWALIAGLVILLAIRLFGFSIVGLIFGSQYLPAGSVLELLAISIPLTFAIQMAAISPVLVRRYRSLTFAWAISSVVAIATNWMLVPSHGAAGVAYALILSEVTLLLGILWSGRQFIGWRESVILSVCSVVVTGSAVFLSMGWNLLVSALVVAVLFPREWRRLLDYLRAEESITLFLPEDVTSIEV
jgi:O-antigen/teichoic acid export membrane protein